MIILILILTTTTANTTTTTTTIGPFGGSIFFACYSQHQRGQITSKYSVEEEIIVPQSCNCCCMNNICIGCHYPCSYYQMYISIKEWVSAILLFITVYTATTATTTTANTHSTTTTL